MTAPALVLEAATLDDLPALVALENSCHTHPWTEQGLRDALRPVAGQGEVLVLRAPANASGPEGGIVAYCAYQVIAGEAHIHNLAVAPDKRRAGIGRRLLAEAIDVARRHGALVVHLDVRQGNVAARALYRAMGFREVGKRSSYYSAPVEDAILLSRTDDAGRPAGNLESPSSKC